MKNLGYTLDCILVNGILKRNQRIALAGASGPVFSNIKLILTPNEAKEIRDATLGNFKNHEWI